MTDPIADMLTRIRNALKVKKTEVVIPLSKFKLKMAEILQQEGYIGSFSINEQARELKISLTYLDNGQPAIHSLERVSKPGRRVYYGWDKLPRVLNELGIAVVSTSQGVMTAAEAKQRKLGGELICQVY